MMNKNRVYLNVLVKNYSYLFKDITIHLLDSNCKVLRENELGRYIMDSKKLLIDVQIEDSTKFLFVLLHELRHHYQAVGGNKDLTAKCKESNELLQKGIIEYKNSFHEYDANKWAYTFITEVLGLKFTDGYDVLICRNLKQYESNIKEM